LKKYFKMMILLFGSALMMQGFQCASREMTTAKVAVQSKDFAKAIEYFNLEVKNNPTNVEAHTALTEVYLMTGNIFQAANSFKNVEQYATLPAEKQRVPGLRNQVWSTAFNTGVMYYQRYFSSKNVAYLDSALICFNIGSELIPRFVDFYVLKAAIYELKNDMESARKEYLNYIENSKNEIQFALDNDVYFNMPRELFVNKMGRPSRSRALKRPQGDSVYTDLYNINNKLSFIFSEKKNNEIIVVGWRINPPEDWLPGEQEQWSPFNTQPVRSLAADYYSAKDFENALKYIKMLTQLDPTDTDANTSLVALYVEMKKEDVALKEMQALIQKDSKNSFYWAQFGDLYLNLGQFDNAIQKYEEALKIRPDYDFVIRNLATSYKNKASRLQQAQQEKIDKDPSIKHNTAEYFPWLEKSAELFERALKAERFKNDMEVLAELANIYMVTNNKAKLDVIISNLEAIKSSIPNDKKCDYYLRMIRLYSDMKMNDKLQEVQNFFNTNCN